MRTRVYSYKRGSRSARKLARSLGVLRLKHEGSRFRPRPSDWIINWGSTNPPYPTHDNILNQGFNVELAADKLQTFLHLDTLVPIPEFTTDRDVALSWFEEGKTVVCRTLTRANSGRGIVMAETEDQLVNAPLYTQYIPKQQEYRVHVFMNQIVDMQRKMRSRDVPDEDVNWQIRNHANGFVFGREDVSLPTHALGYAIDAIAHLGLDFGAVDMVYNERRNQYYVLEVNTAPGLEGTTLTNYTQAFQNFFGGL